MAKRRHAILFFVCSMFYIFVCLSTSNQTIEKLHLKAEAEPFGNVVYVILKVFAAESAK
jgi:hypothetical protein